jgi:RNA polymerase sigma-70 factor (ECF subfamily)
MIPSDQELIVKAQAGDKQAFTELFDRYRKKILSYLYRYTGNYQMAEDITIDTFLNAYTSLSRYKDMGIFSSWLYKIATNRAKDELRKQRQYKEIRIENLSDGEPESLSIEELIADESTRPDYEARKNELAKFIETTLAKLKKKYREALLLCDVEGMGLLEASRILKCNPITVSTRLRRARKIFYDLLEKHGYQH